MALVGLAVLLGSAVAPATAGKQKKGPKIVYAEFGENPANESEYRFRVGAIRSTSVMVKLRESPHEGQTTGPKETLQLSKAGGSKTRPEVWTATTSQARAAPCYRAAYIAKSAKGRHSLVYRLCIFGHGGGTRSARVSTW